MKAITITVQKDNHRKIGLGILLTLVVLFSAILNPLTAQTKVGLRGGLNISEPGLNTDLGNTAGLTKSFTGIDLALASEFVFSPKLALQAELGYNEKGIRLATGTDINVLGSSVSVGVTSIAKVRMIELPMMAKYRLSEGTVRTYAMAGPTVGYTINGNFKTTGSLLTNIDLVNENISLGNQSRWTLGAVGGLGVELDKGHGTLFLDARYHYQALNISGLPIDNVQFRNNGIGFNLGYKINI